MTPATLEMERRWECGSSAFADYRRFLGGAMDWSGAQGSLVRAVEKYRPVVEPAMNQEGVVIGSAVIPENICRCSWRSMVRRMIDYAFKEYRDPDHISPFHKIEEDFGIVAIREAPLDFFPYSHLNSDLTTSVLSTDRVIVTECRSGQRKVIVDYRAKPHFDDIGLVDAVMLPRDFVMGSEEVRGMVEVGGQVVVETVDSIGGTVSQVVLSPGCPFREKSKLDPKINIYNYRVRAVGRHERLVDFIDSGMKPSRFTYELKFVECDLLP